MNTKTFDKYPEQAAQIEAERNRNAAWQIQWDALQVTLAAERRAREEAELCDNITKTAFDTLADKCDAMHIIHLGLIERAEAAEAKLAAVEELARDMIVHLDVEAEEFKIDEEGYDKTLAGLRAALNQSAGVSFTEEDAKFCGAIKEPSAAQENSSTEAKAVAIGPAPAAAHIHTADCYAHGCIAEDQCHHPAAATDEQGPQGGKKEERDTLAALILGQSVYLMKSDRNLLWREAAIIANALYSPDWTQMSVSELEAGNPSLKAYSDELESGKGECKRLTDAVLDNLPYLENLINTGGHESPLIYTHPQPCVGHDFCLMRQAQKGADAIRAEIKRMKG